MELDEGTEQWWRRHDMERCRHPVAFVPMGWAPHRGRGLEVSEALITRVDCRTQQ